MPSNEEAQQSQARRPPAARHPSTSSQVSQSPGSLSTSHRYKPIKHIVGHGRQGGRNTSFGKNLNKLTKLAPANDVVSTPTARHHTRKKSGDSNGSSSSPRPTIKRNASAFVVPRNTSTQSAMKKNHSSGHLPVKKNLSSGHLPRHGSSKNIMKQARPQAPPAKRTRSNRSDKSEPSPPHPTVRFALGDDAGHGDEPEDQHEGDEWTEESASASPHTTRSSTPARQSSIIAEGSMAAKAEEVDSQEPPEAETWKSSARTPPSPRTRVLPDRTRDINGSSSYVASRAPDADVITSRLLQRVPPHNPNPQVTAVNATVTAEGNDVRSLSHSQGSTLASEGTPGRDLVSRFINTSSSRGTPRGGNFLPQTDRPDSPGGQIDSHRRNRSTPNLDKEKDSPTPQYSRTYSHRSSATLPSTELPPSRTQQKLLLQRASSNIEPQNHIPAVIPRAGASQLIGHGVSFSNEGGLPMQLRSLFEQTTKEYQVVRRFRNPVADGIARLSEIPGAPRPKNIPKPKGKAQVNGGDGKYGLSQSYRSREEQNLRESREREQHGQGVAQSSASSLRKGTSGHRSRVSFDLPGRPQPHDDEEQDEGDSYPNSDNGRVRDEAYEICRRLWDIGEVADVG